MTLTTGRKIYRYYTCEPAFIYGSGKSRENGVIIGDPVEFEGKRYWPVKWQFQHHPSLETEGCFKYEEEGA